MPRILGQIFKLKNLRRQPTQSGRLARFTEEIHSVPEQSYRDMNGRLTPFPMSLIIQVGYVLNLGFARSLTTAIFSLMSED